MSGVFYVKDKEAEEALKNIGRMVKKEMLPEGYGFTLLVFPFGEGGGMFYMSSAQRDTMIKAMKEFIENAENEP